MTGTVAIGTALTGATVRVTDANGNTTSATSGANGTYSVSLAGLTAPFLITATDPSGVSSTLYSVVASTTTANGTPVTANVTPLTTAVAALITQSGNPATLAGNASAITPTAITTAEAALDAAIAPILSANGLPTTSFDPVGGAFAPNQTGADAVIDSVVVAPSVAGSGYQISSLAAPNTAIQLNSATPVSTPLANPAQPANYLASLLTSLGQCIAGTASACSGAIDAGYLNNGSNTMQKRHPVLFAAGATLTGVKTVAFLPAGTLPAISNPAALVYFLFTDANGQPNFASDIVQQLPSGNWDVIGNQEQYNLYIASFLGRVQYTDSADSSNGRYESGLNIQIPSSITAATLSAISAIDPSAANNPSLVVSGPNDYSLGVGSALVQGPGLPASGVYMLGADSGSAPYLTFPLGTVTAPAVQNPVAAPSWPDVGMSTTYKWSWTSLSGGASSFTPTTPDYTSTPANVSAITQYGSYTVTLYDYAGNQIGTPQTVLNLAPNVNAVAGATVSWQALGSDVIANLLTPGGSGTSSAGPTAKSTLDWTIPSASAAYPNSWVSINSQGAPQYTNGVETYQAQPYDVTNATAPTVSGTTWSSTVSGYVDVLTATANANVEPAVQVQLGWQADGEYYLNTWQYGNP